MKLETTDQTALENQMAHQKSMGFAFGSDEEGSLRRAHWQRVSKLRGYKKLAEYMRDTIDKDSGFDVRAALRDFQAHEFMVADQSAPAYGSKGGRRSRKKRSKPHKQ